MHQIGYLQSSTDGTPIELDQESRFQHCWAIGQTGTGKSTFATNSFLQDVYNGFGGCYFDFHGEDAKWLLDHIPPERINDVIYLNPLDRDHAIGYNVLDGVRPVDYATYTDEIVAALRHIHADSWGARMDDILINAIRPLFDLPPESQGTMLGVVRMLNDANYRNWVVRQCPEQTVRNFWLTEYAGWTKGEQAHNVNSSLNKIRRFQSSPILRNVLGQQRSRVNLARAIADGQIIICDFNKWQMGAVNASTLASLVLSRLIYEGTRRAMPHVSGVDPNQLIKPFHIVVDEFQTVTSLAMAEALSGIRKYRIGFLLAHQYASQLDEKVMKAIKGNVGTKVVFRVGGEDAENIQRAVDVPNAKELTELQDYNFVAQFKQGHGVVTQRGYTGAGEWTVYGHSGAIRSRMRAKFAVPVVEIEMQYQRWMTSRHYGAQTGLATVIERKVRTKSGPKPGPTTGMRGIGQIMLN